MVQSDVSNIDLKFDNDSIFIQIWMSKIHTYLDKQRVSLKSNVIIGHKVFSGVIIL